MVRAETEVVDAFEGHGPLQLLHGGDSQAFVLSEIPDTLDMAQTDPGDAQAAEGYGPADGFVTLEPEAVGHYPGDLGKILNWIEVEMEMQAEALPQWC